MPPGRRLSWLAGSECQALVASGQLQRPQVQAEIERIGKAQREVAGIVPSPARLSDWLAGEVFPPPGKLMRRARRVLNRVEEPLAWPAIYLTIRLETYDRVVWEDQQRRRALDMDPAPSSPSAAGIRAAGDRNAVIINQIDLDNEEAEQLARYEQVMGEEFTDLKVDFQ